MTEYSLDVIMSSGDLAIRILAAICVLALIFYAIIIGLDLICYVGDRVHAVLDYLKGDK
jgi:hypothetical protein